MKTFFRIVGILIIPVAVAVGIHGYLYETKELQAQESMQASHDVHQQSKTFVEVAKKVTPAVVHILASRKVDAPDMINPFEEFFGEDFMRRFFPDRAPNNPRNPRTPQRPRERQPQLQQGMGSGVIVDPRGYILTNNHVAGQAEEVIVTLGDRRKFKAKIVGADEQTDLAVLKIENGGNLPVAQMGNSDNISVGEWVLAIGNPFGLNQTVTAGIISAKGRANVGIAAYEDFIQTDAPINPGNSGGALVNLNSEIIGINTAIISRTGGYQGIGFAIPINMARNVMNQIVSKGKVTRGWLGVSIQEITPDLAEAFNLSETKGVLIEDVSEGGPAQQAGLKSGDVVVAFNNYEVETPNQLRLLVASAPIGEKVPIKIVRNNRAETVYCVIGDLASAKWGKLAEDDMENKNSSGKIEELEEIGLSVQDLTPDLARQYRIQASSGVIITGTKPNSLAERSLLRQGDVILSLNHQPVKSVSDLKRAMANARKKMYLFQILSGNRMHYTVIRVH